MAFINVQEYLHEYRTLCANVRNDAQASKTDQ